MAGHQLPGHARRLVLPPGFHVHPKYDMKVFRRRMTTKPKKGLPSLPLAPMIDMLCVLVLFLLTNYSSTSEVFFKSYKVAIPEASHGREMRTNPLISISGDTIAFDIDGESGKPVSVVVKGTDLTSLRDALRVQKNKETRIRPGQEFRGQINLQADVRARMASVKVVMNLLVEEGWSAINFVVLKKAEAPAAK
jgi:biopolymer transport protein ExbD